MIRPIDALNLTRAIKRYRDNCKTNAEKKTACNSILCIIGDVNQTPTIDINNLKPCGHWIWDEEDECWVCEKCRASALNDYRGNSVDSDYCPHCGTEMIPA